MNRKPGWTTGASEESAPPSEPPRRPVLIPEEVYVWTPRPKYAWPPVLVAAMEICILLGLVVSFPKIMLAHRWLLESCLVMIALLTMQLFVIGAKVGVVTADREALAFCGWRKRVVVRWHRIRHVTRTPHGLRIYMRHRPVGSPLGRWLSGWLMGGPLWLFVFPAAERAEILRVITHRAHLEPHPAAAGIYERPQEFRWGHGR